MSSFPQQQPRGSSSSSLLARILNRRRTNNNNNNNNTTTTSAAAAGNVLGRIIRRVSGTSSSSATSAAGGGEVDDDSGGGGGGGAASILLQSALQNKIKSVQLLTQLLVIETLYCFYLDFLMIVLILRLLQLWVIAMGGSFAIRSYRIHVLGLVLLSNVPPVVLHLIYHDSKGWPTFLNFLSSEDEPYRFWLVLCVDLLIALFQMIIVNTKIDIYPRSAEQEQDQQQQQQQQQQVENGTDPDSQQQRQQQQRAMISAMDMV